MEHRNIPEDGLHEPKGVSTASDNSVYVSDGSGSGSWQRVGSSVLQGSLSAATLEGQLITADGAGGFNSREAVIDSTEVENGGQTLDQILIDINTTLGNLQTQIADLDDRVAALESV